MKNKRLLILGGNPETAALVKVANDMGVHTVVVDPVENSPAKQVAKESYEVDALDIDALEDLALKIRVDGVLVGVADILVRSYYYLCQRLNLPTYASSEAVDAFSSKIKFIEVCELYDITTTPRFTEYEALNNKILKEEYPLLVKPVDNGGGVGISICQSFKDLSAAIKVGKSASKSKTVLIEKFMSCADMAAYYSFINGTPFLAATSDRYTSNKTYKGSPVCIGASYPSKYEKEFLLMVQPKLLQMFKYLNIKDGVLNIQFFKENDTFYAYDPGFRLQGEGFHIHLKSAFGFDQREALINFSLSNPSSDYSNFIRNKRMGDNFHASTVWVLLKPGVIKAISGLDAIFQLKSYKDILIRFKEGDEVTEQMVGTEKQVFCRIYLQHPNLDQMHSDIDSINKFLEVNSSDFSMIFDLLTPEVLVDN